MIFKKIFPEAIEPVRATTMSAGLDICSLHAKNIPANSVVAVPTGITFVLEASDFETEWFIDMRVRLSIGFRGLTLANGAGVINADYAGQEIRVLLHNFTNTDIHIPAGMRIAQMLVVEHAMNSVNGGVVLKYENRTGGIGSTGEFNYEGES